jgi:hypothetical protein
MKTLRLSQYVYDLNYQCAVKELVEERPYEYFDEFDLQPFRSYLLEGGRPTAEHTYILRHIGFTDDNCRINNHDNVMEVSDNIMDELLLLIGNWINDFESHEHEIGGY